jgi:hypothetical protein
MSGRRPVDEKKGKSCHCVINGSIHLIKKNEDKFSSWTGA